MWLKGRDYIDSPREVKRASWEHNIQTYTKGKRDYFLIICSALLILFGIILLISLI